MATETKIRDRHAKGGQGMNWITPCKRLSIYMRDGLACCYCGEGIEQGAKLTLDHLVCHKDGGTNEASNLVTACHRCNSSRGSRPWVKFAKQVAGYVNHGVTAGQITRHIRSTVKRTLDVNAAKEMIARRGGFSQALAATRNA